MSRQPVDVITLKKNYARLSQELAAAKIELKDAKAFKEKAQKEPLVLGTELINGTLNTINQF